MISKLVKIGSVLLVGTLASLGAAAHAGNINTSGVICQNYNAAQALDIDYFTDAVRNINPAPRPVICSIPRSPLPAGFTPRFFIDGHNDAGTCTPCTVTLYNFDGAPAGSQTLTNCAPAAGPSNWSQFVNFAAIVPPDEFYNYASVMCTLPGNGAGLVYGATAIQP